MCFTQLPAESARRRPPAGDRRLRDHARGLLHERQDRHAGRVRLSPAPSDRHQGRPAHDRAVHRHRPRRPQRRSARRRARLRQQLAAGGDRRNRHRLALRHAQRGCRGQRRARGSLDTVGRRRAAACRRRPPLPAGRSRQARDAQDQLPDDARRGRAVRVVAVRSRPDRQPRAQREHGVLEPRLRVAAQSRRHGREQARPRSAARRGSGLYRSPHHRARQVPSRRSHGDRRSRQGKGKISDVGKE